MVQVDLAIITADAIMLKILLVNGEVTEVVVAIAIREHQLLARTDQQLVPREQTDQE
jgi:hypothetical protein